MAERLVVLSDMWGAKKGLWITSYLGYLQQYFDIVFYDSLQLSDIKLDNYTAENVCEAFNRGGMNTALAQLLTKEREESHYLTFCAGGTIAWNAALSGLPIKSITAVSPLNLHLQTEKPDCKINLLYGEYQDDKPTAKWASEMDVNMEIVPKFGRELYSDDKIIQKVSLNLLQGLLKNTLSFKKLPLVS
ncbi:hypothetical protein [uncultured Eudoraea sp.]|uniref:hypothetical protein n=1 Tax=uncultured Eudoraea sp. TaxID=1035614 RepID=UPI0026304C68|nr:hypothetical protein [uncultured Eudoraea sp.]